MNRKAPVARRDDVLKEILETLERFKIRDVRVYDVGKFSVIADWFIVATGDADRHLDAVAEDLRQKYKKESRRSVEGKSESGWILFDLGDIVVHLFTEGVREHYALDAFWEAAFVDGCGDS